MTKTIIVGAGPAGLACAAALRARGHSAVILEKADRIASVWRRHYDRLHLHTGKGQSSLPGLKMPGAYPRYPSRDQVVAYLQDYAAHFGLAPEFGTEVLRIEPGDPWTVETVDGQREAGSVIVATGWASSPYRPSWPGLETFPGPVVHSSEYRNPAPYKEKSVLVVGFGNSGGEIAMDLADQGVETALSVRGPVNIVPRDLFGIPILSFAIAQWFLPYKLADALNAPVMRLALGNTEKLGLPRPKKGPMAQIAEDGRIPLLDIGTLDRIRKGKIAVCKGIDRIDGTAVHFADGPPRDFDAIILATGYRPDLRSLLPGIPDVLTDAGMPKVSGGPSGRRGLYFCSYRPVPTGQLREIGIEATRIAEAVDEAQPSP